MTIKNKQWLWAALLAATLTACGGGDEESADEQGAVQESADEIQTALTVRQAVQEATVVAGAAPKSTATAEAPQLDTDGGALQTADAGSSVDLGLSISALEGVSSLLARVVGATSYLQISDPNLNESGGTAKALGGSTVFTGRLQVQIPASLRSGQFCLEVAAVDAAGRVSNYRKVCFQIPSNLAPSAPPQVNAGGDVAVGDDAATVTLSGEAKPASGLTVASYQWRQLGSAPAVTVTSGSFNEAAFSFAVPNVSGSLDLSFELRVTDSAGSVGADTVVVSVVDRDKPEPPQVSVGGDREIDEGSSLKLVGSATDTDSAISSVQWQSSRPDLVSFSPVGKASTTVTVGRVAQTTIVQLTLRATDQTGLSNQRSLNLAIRDVAPEPQTLVLSGISASPTLPLGTVIVHVGDQTFTGEVATSGEWSVQAQSNDPGRMVRVEIRSKDDARVRLESYLGQWSDLAEEASAGVLSAEQTYALRVGAFSSALANALREKNASQSLAASVVLDITSAEQLVSAAYGLEPEQVLDQATLLLLLADGTLDLDQQFSSILSVLPDFVAAKALLRESVNNHLAAFADAREAVEADLDEAPGFASALGGSRWVELGQSRFHLSGDQFQLNSDGSARIDAGSVAPAGAVGANAARVGSWTLSGKQVAVTPAASQPFAYTAFDQICGDDPNPRDLDVEETVTRYRFAPILELPGQGPTLLMHHIDFSRRYPGAPDCENEQDTSRYVTLFSRTDELLPFAFAVEPGDEFVLAAVNRDSAATDRSFGFRADVFRFNSGGVGSSEGFGIDDGGAEAFTWRVATDGALQLDYSDGMRVRYYHLSSDDAVGFEAIVLAENGEGYRSSARVTAVEISGPVDLPASEVAGRWAQYSDRRSFPNSFQVFSSFGLKLFANAEFLQYSDNLLRDGSFDSGGEADGVRLGTWRQVSGEVVIDSRIDSTDGSRNCEESSPTCELYSRRTWRPAAKIGNRYYMLEQRDFRIAPDYGQPVERLYNDLRFYDRTDLPAAKGLRVDTRHSGSPARPAPGGGTDRQP